MKVIDDNDDDDDFDDDEQKKSKKLTLAQTIDQVMTIKTHTESSKTELSSRGKRPFKVKKSESLVGSFWFLINPMHCTSN